MSHFSRVKTQMVEEEYLVQALRDLGYSVETGALSIGGFAWQKTPVDIRVATGGYAIGFRRQGEAFTLVGDWWGVKGLSKARFLRLITQRYAYLVTKGKLVAQGFDLVEEQHEKDGRIHLVLRRAV